MYCSAKKEDSDIKTVKMKPFTQEYNLWMMMTKNLRNELCSIESKHPKQEAVI